MKYQKPVNTVQNHDDFSSSLMESYDKWMDGNCFQTPNTISEAPFDGMSPQSNGAEIEDTTKRKKGATKKGAYVGQEASPNNEEAEVLEREEYEIDGEIYVLEKVKMDGVDDNGNTSCWKGYKKQGTKKKGGKEVNNCVKAGVEYEGDELTEKKLDPVGKADADIDNDGDVDKSDKYLHARRKKVGKILAMKKKK